MESPQKNVRPRKPRKVDIGTDPTDAGSTPIVGMKPMMFYGMIGGVVAVVTIGVAVYVLKVRKS
ncbi:MAG: hypothetical protein GWO20_13660 [Candidatus Korarchaeota archaeon]|nr:hypothetical protein [Candidatus Korarchaeota archaeon]NIU85565.1 hypothetical protein [Candidatus Thorarchaeota archaeon]NIW15673.1 hypothetical protein [Candidatus Thorarchaeota archaeon]NIW52612.1 hypothetical protein [Candidatus Korarchaeota archaeon]